MKTSNFIVTLTSILFFFIVQAQELDINWSDKAVTNNASSGVFSQYAGANSKYIYAQFDTYTGVFAKKISKINMVAFDKVSMKKVTESLMFDKSKSNDMNDLEYEKTIVFENSIFVFWEKTSKKGKKELYVQSFDSKLKPENKLRKVYESDRYIFIVGNKRIDEKIFVGTEIINPNAPKGKVPVKLEYKMMKSDFSFVHSGQVDLPLKLQRVPDDGTLICSYELGDDGNLHVKTKVKMDNEERKNAKKNESITYNLFSIVNIAEGGIKTLPIKFDDKNIFDFGKVVTKDAIKLFGLFCDLKKDQRGVDLHGIFYEVIDPTTLEVKNSSFSYFTKIQLDQLFKSDKDKRDRRDGASVFSSKKKQDSESESLSNSYSIEEVESVDNDQVVLFCSIFNNYSSRTCDSKGNCTTNYYCNKRNVTVFKIGKDGQILWATNLDRNITYNGWDVNDLSVVNNNNKFYVIYGNADLEIDNKKIQKKSKELLQDVLEYGVFDNETGRATRESYKVNPNPNAPKLDKKYISPIRVYELDNQFYTYSQKNKIKTGRLITAFGCIVCPPLLIAALLPGSYNSHCFYGKIEVVK